MSATAPLISSTATIFAPQPPSCIAFSPLEPTILLLGTYTLHEHATTLITKKTGTLELYRTTTTSSSSSSCTKGLTHLSSLPTPHGAVLDLKFSPHNQRLVAVALSRGTISLFTLDGEALTPLRSLSVCAPEVLVLSLAFSPAGGTVGTVGYTLSSGAAGVVDVESGEVRGEWEAHALEAWTCEFSGDGGMLFSGGDDAVIVGYDLGREVEVVRSRRGAHGAGVTAVLARSAGEVLTGSYDEVLRVWDLRVEGRMRGVKETGLGGGVWRLHEMARRRGEVLASCMHAGARVVDMKKGDLSVVARWEENESMNYGSHVHPDAPNVVASCSFYDKRVCIWSI